MLTLMITLVGIYATKKGYDLAVVRGRHRRAKRGVWDFGMTRERNDRVEEYERIMGGGRTWTGAKLGSGFSLPA